MDRSELELRYETMLEEYPDTKIIFSEGAAEQFAELMNAEKASSVVIFTGSSKGAAAKAMPNLQNLMAYMNLDFRFYMDIPAEPAVTDVRDMVRMLEEEKPQSWRRSAEEASWMPQRLRIFPGSRDWM